MGEEEGLILHNIPRISILPEIVAICNQSIWSIWNRGFAQKTLMKFLWGENSTPFSLRNKALAESKKTSGESFC